MISKKVQILLTFENSRKVEIKGTHIFKYLQKGTQKPKTLV